MRKYLLISVAVLFVDQVTKTMSEYYLSLGESIKLLPFFDITLVHNHGAAFGFLSDQGGWQRWFFLILASAIIIFLIRWLRSLQPEEKLTAMSLSLILSGAVGNVIDRTYYGYVIDFLDVFVGQYHWPAFNVADSAIVIGAGLMILEVILDSKKTSKK